MVSTHTHSHSHTHTHIHTHTHTHTPLVWSKQYISPYSNFNDDYIPSPPANWSDDFPLQSPHLPSLLVQSSCAHQLHCNTAPDTRPGGSSGSHWRIIQCGEYRDGMMRNLSSEDTLINGAHSALPNTFVYIRTPEIRTPH